MDRVLLPHVQTTRKTSVWRVPRGNGTLPQVQGSRVPNTREGRHTGKEGSETHSTRGDVCQGLCEVARDSGGSEMCATRGVGSWETPENGPVKSREEVSVVSSGRTTGRYRRTRGGRTEFGETVNK